MIKKELDIYRKRGVDLYLEGKASTPGTIAKACAVAEHGTYMRDYCPVSYTHLTLPTTPYV